MSSVISLHSVVDKHDWNLEEIKKFLERDSSSVNETNRHRETPLLCILKKENCSAEVVKLLLKFGADINCVDRFGRSTLNIALQFSRDESVIRVLVEKGVNVVKTFCQSSLCLALSCGASKVVIELLLETGCSPNECWSHCSMLHCAIFYPNSGLKRDIFQLLIKRGADVRTVDRIGRTLLCSALQNGNEACIIKLLLAAGVSLNACSKHASPLFCVTEGVLQGTPFKAEVVELLLRTDVCVNKLNEAGRTPLEYALQNCKYETEAIRLLVQGVDLDKIVDESDNSLLHVAVSNEHCKPSVVNLLIKHGIEVTKVNNKFESALHVALKNRKCKPNVVKTLLEKGAILTQVNMYGRKPLRIAVEYWQDASVLKVLLAAGALLKTSHCCNPLLKIVLEQWECVEERVFCFKMFLKYFFLETSYFDCEHMLQHRKNSEALSKFRDDCKQELQKMKLTNVGEDLTLHNFLCDYASIRDCLISCGLPIKTYDFDQLLNVIRDNAYPLYFGIISTRIGRSSMEKKLQEVLVYTVKFSLDKRCIEQKIILNYDSVCSIAQYLAEDDLLRLILAFYDSSDHCTDETSKEKNEGKRSAELIEQFCKRPKLQ